MKLLYLSQYFPPEMGAPAARVSDMAAAWTTSGHQVTVLTGLPNHPTGVVPQKYRGRPFFRESRHGYSVVRVWLYATPNRGFFKRAINFLSFLTSAVCIGALLTERPQVLIATSPQLLVGAAGLALARLKGIPFVFEVRDLWPKTAVELGVLRNPRLIAFLETLEKSLYRAAALVIIVSEDFRDHIRAAGVPDERIVFIPNGYDTLQPEGTGMPAPLPARRLPGVFTVAYVGTHGVCQGLSTIVDVAERFRGDPSVRFLFVGAGAEKDLVVRKARDLELKNCTFLDPVPREAVGAIYQESDVCLVPLIDRPVFRTVLPSKLFEIMALGKPIVLSVGGRAERLVEEARTGLSVPPEDVEAIANAIGRLRDDDDLRTQLASRGPQYIACHFDRSALARRYADALEKLVS